MNITIVAGARPNFIKIAPLIHALQQRASGKITYRLVHTGQHYNANLSDTFFTDLRIPQPDVNLNVGSGSQASQTAAVMIKFEEELQQHPTDYVIVVGDVNSTLACSVVAKKMNTQLLHIEAGLRSFDLAMPEEINRMVTDALADYYFTTSQIANANLLKAGVPKKRIFFVGNIMIDSLKEHEKNFAAPPLFNQQQMEPSHYWVLTLHRPSNVDDSKVLRDLLIRIDRDCGGLPVIFPIHPRTEKQLAGASGAFKNIVITSPLGYLNFMYLIQNSIGVITDSGGIQEETTVMKIPCLTLRENTERPETVSIGTNELTRGTVQLQKNMKKVLAGRWKKGRIPPYWDGKTAERIVKILLTKLAVKR
jgi:UDP-N-acetylglucosamine 2-epimerase (non-hydrolysing)